MMLQKEASKNFDRDCGYEKNANMQKKTSRISTKRIEMKMEEKKLQRKKTWMTRIEQRTQKCKSINLTKIRTINLMNQKLKSFVSLDWSIGVFFSFFGWIILLYKQFEY